LKDFIAIHIVRKHRYAWCFNTTSPSVPLLGKEREDIHFQDIGARISPSPFEGEGFGVR